MPGVDVNQFRHLEDVGSKGLVVLRFSSSVPTHVGWWGDVRALHTGNVAIRQVVVQQNEVGFGPVHCQFIVVVEGHIGQEQRPRNAVNGLQSVEVG